MRNLPEYIQKFVGREENSIFEILDIINANNKGFAIILDDAGRVIGVITDGDIRREILRGIQLDAPASSVMHTSYKSAVLSRGFLEVIELFKDNKIEFFPIVDEKGHLVNIITKKQMHTVLLQNMAVDLKFDFFR